jgi:Rhodopirellula transposase DDE domain
MIGRDRRGQQKTRTRQHFKNPGRYWESAPLRVYDHDLGTDSIGVAIPYGIYDVLENRRALTVGVSHDTSVFAAHAIAHWWNQQGSTRYRGSRQLLTLADTGGVNSCRRHSWKTELQSQLANPFALAVTVAHYPAGASKWNPIEHRLFSEVSRNWAGEPLDSYQKILNYARTTRTQPGLHVTAYLDHRFYPCGLKPTPDQIASLRLQRHETLPEWNYTIKPQLKLVLA